LIGYPRATGSAAVAVQGNARALAALVLSVALAAGCAERPATPALPETAALPPAKPELAPRKPELAPRKPEPARVRPAESAPGQNQFYDPGNPAFPLLQKANEALAGFPVDNFGTVEWMAALRSGLIAPRADLEGKGRMEVLDMDIVMKNTRQMPYVLFPHRAHTQWLDCSNCHPAIFQSKAGAHQITMNDIFRGEYCGKCHDRIAFVTFFSCERCHRVPHGEIKAWWEQ